jgi:vanZ family protein
LAAATEAAQAWFTAHRSGDLLDALADLAGTALALLLARQVCRNRRGM